ncbi:MAG: riboflavin synthase [Deltaproteobacteria bacterium]|nr:MAG: riboflavin synthase [Deltaproteobacteria bacterium]
MFTGLIEDVGVLRARSRHAGGARLAIETGLPLAEVAIGDSIAINGACLTAVTLEPRRFWVDVSTETLRRTTLGDLALGSPVNLERALRIGDRLDGHLVQGHVDGVARFVGKKADGDGWELTFELPEALLPQVVEKGSICIDGVSLTVATLADPRVTIAVIPHTGVKTTLAGLTTGASVNIETDVIGKYVQRVLGRAQGASAGRSGGQPSGLTRETLAALGFE